MIKKKIKSIAILLTACALILSVVLSSVTEAAYYTEQYPENTRSIMIANMLMTAAKRCINYGKFKEYGGDWSLNLTTRNRDVESIIDQFLHFTSTNEEYLASTMFDRVGDGKSWSTILEGKYTPSGYDDGIVWCDEVNLIPQLMMMAGIYDEDHIDGLLCDGEYGGLFDITAEYFGARNINTEAYDRDVAPHIEGMTGGETVNDCKANLDFARTYLGRPGETVPELVGVYGGAGGNATNTFDFVISFMPSENRAQHFEKFISNYFTEGWTNNYISESWDALKYWQYRDTFDIYCATINNNNTTPPLSTSNNVFGLYDAVNKKIYYHDTDSIHRDVSLYYDVNTETKKTCWELAEELGAADPILPEAVDERKIKKLIEATQKSEVNSCIATYAAGRRKIEEYKDLYSSMASKGNNFINHIQKMYKAIDGVFHNGEEEVAFTDDTLLLQDVANAVAAYKSTVGSLWEYIRQGIDGNQIFVNDNIDRLQQLSDQLVDETNFRVGGIKLYVTDTAVTEEELAEAGALIREVADEQRVVQRDADSLRSLLSQYPENNNDIWEISTESDNAGIVCTGVDEMIAAVEALNLASPPSIGGWTPPSSSNPVNPYNEIINGNQTSPCYANSGTMGWFICPIAEAATGIGQALWGSIEDSLRVPANEVFENDGAVKRAWDMVRDMGNIAFIALFLFVIFSQLTGVGIDNYGVKKILPKLIMVGILVNLSYFLCQIAVDVSNILGVGLNSMLSNFSMQVGAGAGADTGWQIGSWLTTGIAVGGVGTIWVLLSSGGVGSALGSLGLAVLGLIITVVVAIIFLYVILGVRMAGVILGIVLSPVAIVCYALPNTNKLYKKWFDLFKAVLIVYPICGAMVGSGKFAGAILSNVSGMGFIATLVQVAPFFFVPTVLKGSLALMGNVGAKLSSFGRNIGRRGAGFAKGTIANSDRYKNRMQYNNEQVAMRRAKRTQGKLQARLEKGNLSDKKKARLSDRLRRAQDTLIAGGRRERENELRSSSDYFDSALAAEEADVVDRQTSQRLSLMMNDGIMLAGADGVTKVKAAYTLNNAEARMEQLRREAAKRDGGLNKDERVELAALARGLASMKGGGGVLGRMVREAKTDDGKVNGNFMRAFGEVYSRDSIVQKKLNEKDAGASAFTEEFMPGATGGVDSAFGDYSTKENGELNDDYKREINKRIKSYEAGLNQSGMAVKEYLKTLKEQDCQAIMDNEALVNSLDTDVRRDFLEYAKNLGVTAPRVKTVNIAGGGVATTASSGNSGGVAIEGQAYSVRDSGSADAAYIRAEAEQRAARIKAEAAQRASSIESISQNIGNESGMDYSSE